MGKLLLLFSLISLNTFSQVFNWKWVQHTGSTRHSESICTDALGNVYVAGGFGGTAVFGNDTLTSNGAFDVFLVKYDPLGNAIWAKSAGGTYDDLAYGVAIGNNETVYITGYIRSSQIIFGTDTLSSPWMSAFLARYDSSGNVLFAKASSSGYDTGGYGICTDISGNVYVTGQCQGSITFSFGNLALSNPGKVYIYKFDSLGVAIWGKSSGVNFDNCPEGITCDQNGDIVIVGNFKGSIAFDTFTLTSSSSNYEDFFVTKYSPNGNAIWAKSYGGSNFDWVYGVASDNNNNVFVTGAFTGSSLNFGPNMANNFSTGSADLFVAKLDPFGNEAWIRGVGGATWDIAIDVCTDQWGNAFVTGYFGSSPTNFGAYTFTNNGLGYNGNDLFIAKYNTNGTVVNAISVGGSDHDEMGQAITVDKSDNIYTTGGFKSSQIIFGADTISNPQYWQMYVAKLKEDLITNVPHINSFSGSIYPNPSNGAFYIDTKDSKKSKVCIYDPLGRCVFINEAYHSDNKIDLGGNPKGLYIIEVLLNDQKYYKKVLLE